MSVWVVCQWVERSEDGRALSYGHQLCYENARDAWAAFYNEQTVVHSGADLQIDLVDSGKHLSKWTPEHGEQPSNVPVVPLRAITDLAEKMRKRSEER